jgi:hypothetical protein
MLTREPELRFHHLLCLPLFQGKGYSDGFSVNMQSVKDRLESEDTAVRFVCSGDMICQHCPNRTEDGCLLDGCGGTVAQKDSEVCRFSEIECHSVENYRSALTRLRSKMDKKAFDILCSECRWAKLGLCSFEKWREGVDGLLSS